MTPSLSSPQRFPRRRLPLALTGGPGGGYTACALNAFRATSYTTPAWRNGIRGSLKNCSRQRVVGSNPTAGTTLGSLQTPSLRHGRRLCRGPRPSHDTHPFHAIVPRWRFHLSLWLARHATIVP